MTLGKLFIFYLKNEDSSTYLMGFLGSSDGKESAFNAGDPGLNPGSGRFPGEGNGNHYSILAWRITWTEEPGGLPWSCKELDMTELLTHTHTHTHARTHTHTQYLSHMVAVESK